MKKIKLLTAPYKYYNQFMPPVALGIISQHLFDNNIDHDKDDLYVKLHYEQKKGNIKLNIKDNEISKWDAYIKGEDNEDVEEIVSEIASLTNFEGYGVLLFSAGPPGGGDIPNHILPLALFRFLKKKYNSIIITNNQELGGKDKGLVDEIIVSIPQLFNYLREKLHLDVDSALKIGVHQNLDGFPLPLYNHEGVTVIGYSFFNGCPYNCYFCDRYFMLNLKKNERLLKLPNPEEVVYGIKELVHKYGFKNFMFLNSTINPTQKFANDVVENIIKADIGIKWCDCANFWGMSTELLDKLKESGCVKLVFGLETASKRLQKRINKVIDLAHVERIIKHCYEIGIWVDVTLLCGLPYETYQDIYETLLFIRKNYRYLRGINLNKYMTKCNEFYYNAKKHGLIIKKVNNWYTNMGFDEVNGMKWKEKWEYTEEVYKDIKSVLDQVRVDYVRPVNHIFKIVSKNVPISEINNFIDNNVLNNDTSKIDLLIQKYEKFI